jgi:hypothetical protein
MRGQLRFRFIEYFSETKIFSKDIAGTYLYCERMFEVNSSPVIQESTALLVTEPALKTIGGYWKMLPF